MALQSVCERPMSQRAAVEIGAQGQDQGDVGVLPGAGSGKPASSTSMKR